MNTVIGLIAGSLRKESFSKKIAWALIDMAPEGFEFKIISIEDLPVYNQDFDDYNNVPESYVKFREEIRSIEGVIFITPEHNRSVPAALKNAIDIGSRPSGKSVWNGKPGAVFSNSPGNLSAFGANHHLRQSLVFLNIPTMQQPEVYLPHINKMLDENGNLNDKDTKDFLQKAVDAYIEWFKKNK
ncbi:NADPH-dependent FMN reductase [Chryseobacterium lactis]|uniref:NAD(P)H-dependent oxidoreductase n=1 Tax=Chryseobacterium lactis TaxID=1241981 RepID=A0A3G6RVD7_CHRLC|nr:NAD(P)H-dependent oxidoreductase [Chryseobacterium lactis]AZA80852.1 NAD(P)H-dependent oxidoreductase [Chryseobacterium lactis]AZB05854.1 NAD(P)H-dependent oxidoreductase [Chryseobacterium lactis]PNW13732.1 NADPH-dependent FMN reductase [Chryseobacterium lactis]